MNDQKDFLMDMLTKGRVGGGRGPIPMGLLPDWAIRDYIPITPFAEGEKRPGEISYGLTSYGYDARLGNRYKIFTACMPEDVYHVDPKNMKDEYFMTYEGGHCIIPPNSYALAESYEHFKIPDDVCAICVGKSTMARCGLIVNVTPLEPGWEGHVTIEISNASPVPAKVYSFEGIMQVQFHRAAPCDVNYRTKGGKYQAQKGLTLPKVD